MSERFIHVGSVYTVERLDSQGKGGSVVKYPTAAVPTVRVRARLEREYKIGASLSLPGVRRAVRRLEWKGHPAIELEYIPGESFKAFFRSRQRRQIRIVLRLALSAARALASLHDAGVVHRDIAAGNLLVREGASEAVVIDLGFATRGGDRDYVFTVEGQLPYLSPEQTGRIELPVDERSDLYAFGIVFYEMLTGSLPFQAEDAAGWIHAHLARLPEPPLAREPGVPTIVSDMAMRLLAKAPENRYQSARGLCHDLERCLGTLDAGGAVPDFPLGHGDHSGRLKFPTGLYGRDQEQRQLQEAFRQATAGRGGLQFVAGYAGAGKTSLVNELRFPAAAAGGRFVGGKFDQTLRGLPYVAFTDAFSQLCHQFLAGTPEELSAFRDRVLESLGANAGLLLELLPALETVIGPQETPPPLDTIESSNRFAVTLLSFFHCMVTEEQPLVLFLDDAQWADAASLDLVHMIVTRAVSSHFLLICAYRDDELGAGHPLTKLMETLQREWPHAGRLSLSGLNRNQSSALVADVLDVAPEQATPLAELLHAKTDGNPFFLRQVLETLASEAALYFDYDGEGWHWDTDRVRALAISDNVIELMLHKISRLPVPVREVLQVAACIGNTFSLELLASAGREWDQPPQALLAAAVEEGLVALVGDFAQFAHDRIQQAVYQTLSAAEARHIHLLLGRHLLEQRRRHDVSLTAVQHLNLGAPLIESPMERRQLAELNLEAGDTARAKMAYAEARDFYTNGFNLPYVDAERVSQLTFELRFHQAETTFCLGEVASAVRNLRELLEEPLDISSRSRVYQLLLDINTTEVNLAEALDIGMEALATLGAALPEERSEAALLARVEEIDRIVTERGVERIGEWPPMDDDRELAIAGLLAHLVTPAYISASPAFPFISVEFARRSLQGGLSRFSPFAFSTYGMLLAVALRRYDAARTMGRLATDIAGNPEYAASRARADFFHAVFVLHWCEPLEATLPLLDDGWKIGVESGDLPFASYCINHIHGHSLLAGQSLVELEQSFAEFADVNRVIRQEDGQLFFGMLKRTVEGLRRASAELPDPSEEIGGAAIIETWREKENASLRFLHQLLRCLLAVILDKPVEALSAAEQAAPLLDGVFGTTWVPHHHFLHALALADAARDGRHERGAAREQIGRYRAQFEEWAAPGPDNYRPKWLLLHAELGDLENEESGVLLDAYDEAISAATRAGRTLDHALACERAAGCWRRRDKPHIAGLYLQQAMQGYEAWGADAKVAQLRRDWAALLRGRPSEEESSATASNGSGESLHAVDVNSVLKAAQTVAGELVIDRMLARLIGLAVETAGAQSGFLLLEQDNRWCVVAEQGPDHTSAEVLQWRPLADYPQVAATVVRYVARTKKVVNLDDAGKSTLFTADRSIATRHPKSLLCLPIVNRGELGGILYLENNLATSAFTRTHTRILQLLMSQAISSLEISRYYARVQDLNRSLEEEIDERKRTEAMLEFLANHDALTELPNRRLFYDRVAHAIQRAQRGGGRVAVLFLDLDRFKNINDTLSHQVGDRLLQQVAQRLVGQVREGDTVGRLGGDEYVVLVEGSFDPGRLSRIADKLLAVFREPVYLDGHDLYLTCSLGISLYPDDAADTDELLRNADAAMYQAKQSGRNTFRFFSAELAAAAAERIGLERELHRAVEGNELELYFQPQVELQSGAIIGAEALLRWNHPERGLLGPFNFVPQAEESGFIVTVGEWVLHRACRQLEQWRREGTDIGSLAVNVSSRQLGPRHGFTELVKEVLDASDFDPWSLELELTESVTLRDTASVMGSLEELTALGVRLAIDDFGTGYSSLSYLHRLPAQRLKVDRSFVSNLPHARDSAAIVQSILSLGQNLSKTVIAEGIETDEQRRFLLQAGCTEGQGYLFGPPMPLAKFQPLLRHGRIG